VRRDAAGLRAASGNRPCSRPCRRPHAGPRARLALLAAALALAGCSTLIGESAPPEPATLKSLAGRRVVVQRDSGPVARPEEAIEAWRGVLQMQPSPAQRAEALRRLGDLEMERVDARMAEGRVVGQPADFAEAVGRYESFLAAYPKDPGNFRVYYQLARAHETAGNLDEAQKWLDRLVREYPDSPLRDEVHFRRGEMLFSAREYAGAEAAYAAVLTSQRTPFQERAQFMLGWSQYKQDKLPQALAAFFAVLDLKIPGRGGEGELDSIPGLTRGDRELLEDTFRIISISLAAQQGAEAIPAYIDRPERRPLEVHVYQQLAALYQRQERVKDAADTLAAFARLRPLHPQAPVLQARVIEIYQGAGFDGPALQAKRDYVAAYGPDSAFARSNPEGWQRAKPLVLTHLGELARTFHARAQRSKAPADTEEAVRWYRTLLKGFPDEPAAAGDNFLLAELLFESQQFGEAAQEYLHTAYDYPRHERSAEAGYAALLTYAELTKRAASPDEKLALQRSGINQALRFADTFAQDARAPAVLTNAADELFALGQARQAAEVAEKVLALKPSAPDAQRRVAWTVVAHEAFERAAYERAERGYTEVLALTPANAPQRGELVERVAASVYKQGEKAREAGQLREAVGHFERVAAVAPASPVRATAHYDAAAALLALKDWGGAARSLEAFRQRYPQHPLAGEVTGKLATAYLEEKQWGRAAAEFERLAAAPGAGGANTPEVARAALWQAAELYDKAEQRSPATRSYERYLQLYPAPLEPAVEARARLAKMAREAGQGARELALMKQVLQADQGGGEARTERTRVLGAQAALVVAAPSGEAYRQVRLVEPLQKQLKLKKERMEEALKAYALAANYGVADVASAATFHIASLYQDFGKSLLGSQRPKKLSKLELEQYEVLLEEQAFPFEEKAIELHETNARRSAGGLYDDWVRRSYEALGQLRPVRYGKAERGGEAVHAIR
jgi:tetratricopeptide (TPR) repeat protein